MSRADDPRLAEAKAMPIEALADRLTIAGLKRCGHELVGPCPVCGGDDRFAINPRKGMFLCRICGAKGDGIALVRHVLAVDFKGALDWMVGAAPAQLSQAEMDERARIQAENKQRKDKEAEQFHARAMRDARRIWDAAAGQPRDMVVAYLARRGITGPVLDDLPRSLRFIAAHRYMRTGAPDYVGPAMIAAVQRPDGSLGAVHQTWIDLAQPNGKALIVGPDGKAQKSKLTRGSKQGGAIRFGGPNLPGIPDTLVMGEGIETTLSAREADPIPGAVYWAGVDLGNMAGGARYLPGKRYSDIPDMECPGFVPPPWVRRLIYIMDGDSEPVSTRARCLCGLRRAQATRPGLVAQLVAAAPGQDLNDMLRGVAND